MADDPLHVEVGGGIAVTGEARAGHGELEKAHEQVRLLEMELEETNRGLIALSLELRQKEQEVRDMTDQLWQSARLAAVGELAASIAHEFNNPLAALGMRLELLLSRDDSSERRTWLLMQKEVDRMANLVSGLLGFSRRRPTRRQAVQLRDELSHTAELIGFHLTGKGVRLVDALPLDLPDVDCDPQLLRQVFLNLLTNAADAMPHGGSITVRARELPLPDQATAPVVDVEIIDEGSGIAPNDLIHVMDRFFTTKPEGKGTGLGLPICRRIIEEHGGRIGIESEPGRGTTVRFSLPLAIRSRTGILLDD